MRGRRRIANQPIRLVAGASMLNDGMEKLNADEMRASAVPEMAEEAGPGSEGMPTEPFVKVMSVAEVGIGAALVLPLLPDRLVGLFLTAFVGGKFLLRGQNDGIDQLRPTTTQPKPAKDAWLLGIGLTLLATGPGRRRPARAKPGGPDALP